MGRIFNEARKNRKIENYIVKIKSPGYKNSKKPSMIIGLRGTKILTNTAKF
jgi:hypothetical protein